MSFYILIRVSFIGYQMQLSIFSFCKRGPQVKHDVNILQKASNFNFSVLAQIKMSILLHDVINVIIGNSNVAIVLIVNKQMLKNNLTLLFKQLFLSVKTRLRQILIDKLPSLSHVLLYYMVLHNEVYINSVLLLLRLGR